MTLVLLVLAVIWAAVLIPPALRARAEGRPADSISAFHRQLSVLRRTGPRVNDRYEPVGASTVVSHPRWQAAAVAGWNQPAQRQMARKTTQRRRRDILAGLGLLAGLTLVLGIVPALRPLLLAHVVIDALIAGYVALLVRCRNVAAEREMKVRFLPTAAMEPALVRRSMEPALVRRSAN